MDMSKSYHLSRLTIHDLENIMHWRMLPHVTKYMNTDPILTTDGQKKWFEKLSAYGEIYYWIICVNDIPCGVINLADVDMTSKRCTWGYYIAEKKLRSLELAMSLEMSLYDYAFDILKLNKVTGESLCINAEVIKMHELCGCKTEGILRQHTLKNEQYYDVCVQSMLAEDWKNLRNDFEYIKITFS